MSGVLNHELCEVVGRLCMELHMPVAGEGALLFIIFTKESLTPKGLVLYTSSYYKPGVGTLFSVKGQSKYFHLHRPVSAPTTQVCRCSSKAVCQPVWISIKWKQFKYHPLPLHMDPSAFPRRTRTAPTTTLKSQWKLGVTFYIISIFNDMPPVSYFSIWT